MVVFVLGEMMVAVVVLKKTVAVVDNAGGSG